jgi:hypothetical protein
MNSSGNSKLKRYKKATTHAAATAQISASNTAIARMLSELDIP